jgi:hypothetical protein
MELTIGASKFYAHTNTPKINHNKVAQISFLLFLDSLPFLHILCLNMLKVMKLLEIVTVGLLEDIRTGSIGFTNKNPIGVDIFNLQGLKKVSPEMP